MPTMCWQVRSLSGQRKLASGQKISNNPSIWLQTSAFIRLVQKLLAMSHYFLHLKRAWLCKVLLLRMCTPVVLPTVPKFCEIHIKVHIFLNYFYLFCSAQDVLDGVDSAFSLLTPLLMPQLKLLRICYPHLNCQVKLCSRKSLHFYRP